MRFLIENEFVPSSLGEGMSRLELMKQNKKRYSDLEKKISTLPDGLEKDVAKYLGLLFIKGRNWEGGLGGGKDIDRIYQKLMDKYNVDFETVDDIFTKNFIEESLTEDTIKQNGKWVNKGKEGTHGKFRTKKQADAQRRAMFAGGYTEDWNIEDQIDAPEAIGKLKPGDKFKNRNGVVITIIDPLKYGTIQFKIQSKNYPYEIRFGKEKSIQRMLYRNNYMRINDWK